MIVWPDDQLVDVDADRVLGGRLLPDPGEQVEQVPAHLLGVGRPLPEPPRPGRVPGEHRTDRDRIALRSTVRVVAAVGIEGVLNRKVSDGAEGRFGVPGMSIARRPGHNHDGFFRLRILHAPSYWPRTMLIRTSQCSWRPPHASVKTSSRVKVASASSPATRISTSEMRMARSLAFSK